MLLALWLASHEIARMVRLSRLPGYIAARGLAGYAWLATAGHPLGRRA